MALESATSGVELLALKVHRCRTVVATFGIELEIRPKSPPTEPSNALPVTCLGIPLALGTSGVERHTFGIESKISMPKAAGVTFGVETNFWR